MYKHYIRIDKDKNIIKTFTDAFETPEENDILIEGNGARHFVVNLVDVNGTSLYKYEKKKLYKF